MAGSPDGVRADLYVLEPTYTASWLNAPACGLGRMIEMPVQIACTGYKNGGLAKFGRWPGGEPVLPNLLLWGNPLCGARQGSTMYGFCGGSFRSVPDNGGSDGGIRGFLEDLVR